MIAKILVSSLCLFCTSSLFAQTTTKTTTHAQTGIRITTTSTPLQTEPTAPTRAQLEADIDRIQRNLADMRNDPNLVANGTVAKLEAALRQKQSELEALPR